MSTWNDILEWKTDSQLIIISISLLEKDIQNFCLVLRFSLICEKLQKFVIKWIPDMWLGMFVFGQIVFSFVARYKP